MKKEFSRRLALFKRADGHVTECSDWADRVDDYVRISEYVAIDFPPLLSEEVTEKQLRMLDKKEQEARLKFQEVLDFINSERGKLLALTAN